MKHLTEEEFALFDSKEKCIQLLMNPLLYLTKGDVMPSQLKVKKIYENFEIDEKGEEFVQKVHP